MHRKRPLLRAAEGAEPHDRQSGSRSGWRACRARTPCRRPVARGRCVVAQPERRRRAVSTVRGGLAVRSRLLPRFRRLRAADARTARTPQGVHGPAPRGHGARRRDALRARTRRGLPVVSERPSEPGRSPPPRAVRHAARGAPPGRCDRGALLRGSGDAAAGTRHAGGRPARCDPREGTDPDDARIRYRNSFLPRQRIAGFSHQSVHIAPNNAHYRGGRDYRSCGQASDESTEAVVRCLAAPNPWCGEEFGDSRAAISGEAPVARLTYNPRFGELLAQIDEFLAADAL